MLIAFLAFQCSPYLVIHCNLSLFLQCKWEEGMGTTHKTQKSAPGRYFCYLSVSCLHPSHLQQELSSLNTTFPSLATCSIFSCLPLLHFFFHFHFFLFFTPLSISLWSPRRLCPHSNKDFLCVGGDSVLLSIAGHLELQASETGTVACLPFRTLSILLICHPPFITILHMVLSRRSCCTLFSTLMCFSRL